jgi:hypothetical protein
MSRIMRASHESFSGQPDSARHGLGTIHAPGLCDENEIKDYEQNTRAVGRKMFDNRSTIPPRQECGNLDITWLGPYRRADIAYLDVMHGNGMCRFLTVTVSTRLW